MRHSREIQMTAKASVNRAIAEGHCAALELTSFGIQVIMQINPNWCPIQGLHCTCPASVKTLLLHLQITSITNKEGILWDKPRTGAKICKVNAAVFCSLVFLFTSPSLLSNTQQLFPTKASPTESGLVDDHCDTSSTGAVSRTFGVQAV